MADCGDLRKPAAGPGERRSREREERQTQEARERRGEDTVTGGVTGAEGGVEMAKEDEVRKGRRKRVYLCRRGGAC